MINLEDCVEIGGLAKPHGIKGHLILKLNNLSFDDIEEMELVYIIIDGLPVPFFIEEFTERNNDALLIKLEDIDSETTARKYSDSTVFIDKAVLSSQKNTTADPRLLYGYRVIDQNFGDIGVLDTLLDFDQNPVLRILKEKKEILIPFQEEFFVKIDEPKREVYVSCPKGLLDLYL